MKFLVPQWLWAIPPILALGLGAWIWCGREFHRRLGLFAAARLRTAQLTGRALLRKRIGLLLRILALAALCAALARPLGDVREQAAKRRGVNVLIALDGSRSMLAEDVQPSRFTLAQAGIESLLRSFRSDRAGLLMFAGEPIVASPLSFDTVSLEVIGRGMSVELAGKGGTSLSSVIERAAELFRSKAYASKVLVIFSDGEETEGDAVMAAQEAYVRDGIRIFTVGTGTAQGAVIPRFVRNAERDLVRSGVVRNEQGKEVHSRMDEQLLRMVSTVAGGAYVDLQAVKGDLGALYVQSLEPLAAPMEEVQLQDLKELYPLPLALALLLLMLEKLIPGGKTARQAAAMLMLTAAMIFPGLVCAATTLAQAQRLFEARAYDQAFKLLQGELLKAPQDELTSYNYALAAYAAGKYSVAIERFGQLSRAGDARVRALSALQLGNSLYRLGEQMLAADNAAGAVIQWQKALAAYGKEEGAAARHNQAKTKTDILAIFIRLARAKERAGDEEARLSADKGIPAWQDALGYLDQAVALPGEDRQGSGARASRQRVARKIFMAYMGSAEELQRRAQLQKNAALEMAIENMQSAVGAYESALALQPGNRSAEAGRREATESLQPWLVELADQLHQQGIEQRQAQFLDDAMASWKEAGGHYAQVLERNAANAGARRGQEKNNRALHDGYVALGDAKQQRAERSIVSTQEKDALLEGALGDYRSALALQPGDAAATDKLMTLGKKLTGRFVARGQTELGEGRKIASESPERSQAPKTAEAIAWLERSMQSFGKALSFEERNAPALAGRKEAEELLKKLRELDAGRQRQLLAKNKQMNDARPLDDPRELALKLLDYDTRQLAAKKQQNVTAPENRPLKDW